MKDAYFDRLKDLIRLEREEEISRFEDERLEKTLKEREKQGFAMAGLEIISTGMSPGGHSLVEFSREDGHPLPAYSFDEGDGASLCVEKGGLVYKPVAVVYERTDDSVTLAFTKPLPESVERADRFCLLKSPNTVVYRYMEEALERVREADGDQAAFLRDISLGAKKAKPAFSLDSGIAFRDTGLNAVQKEAVRMASANPQIALIHGPPGTGKTTVLVEIIAQAVRSGKQIFVCAPSNTASDHLLRKITDAGMDALRLGHPARIARDLRRYTSGHKTAAHPLGATLKLLNQELAQLSKKKTRLEDRYGGYDPKSRELRLQIRQAHKDIGMLKKQITAAVLNDANICVGTLTGVLSYLAEKKIFDLVVMDEATQATEPMSWIPALKGKALVMAGDHRQLPPTVLSKEAQDAGLGLSLFERLHDRVGDEQKMMLTTQYRMNETIMRFPSGKFYGGRLIADASVREAGLKDLPGVSDGDITRRPFEFIDTAGKGFQEITEPGSESRYNPEEAQIVSHYVEALLKAGVAGGDIAVISPYSAQTRRLRRHFKGRDIEVNTVDGFQGREKEVILLTCVRSNLEGELGFLADLRRMNVAITRARKKLVVIGDSGTLSSLPFFDEWIKYAESVDGYKSVWELPESGS